MKRFKVLSIAALLLLSMASLASATPSSVYLYVDAAPNAYGSPNYAPWETAAFAAAAQGSFINMSSGTDPANSGTTNFTIQDDVVYSFGDLGKRLTWIYWIPNETKASLEPANRFMISLTNIWDGLSQDFYLDYYSSTWLEPTKWVDYDKDKDGTTDGVIGTAGMAWWGAYGINTQEALDADLAAWGSVAESWIFTAKLDGVEYSITSKREPVPEPATMLLFGAGLIGIGVACRRKIAN